MDYKTCELCPRKCGADRTAGKTGFCGCPDTALVAIREKRRQMQQTK